MSNSLDPDQARHNVGTDLGPNYLQRLSAEHTRRQRFKLAFRGYLYSKFSFGEVYHEIYSLKFSFMETCEKKL